MAALTAEQLQENMTKLSEYSEEQLNELTVATLRKKMREIGVSMLLRDGEEISIVKGRKSELVTAILLATKKTKILENIAPELTPLDMEAIESLGSAFDAANDTDYSKLAISTFKVLRDYVQTLWDSANGRWTMPDGSLGIIASKFIENVRRAYPDVVREDKDGNEVLTSRHHSRLGMRGSCLKMITKMIETDCKSEGYYQKLQEIFGSTDDDKTNPSALTFRKLCFYALSEDSKTKKVESVKRQEKRGNNRTRIDIKETLEIARETLSSLNDDSPSTLWKEVVLAITLLTGRRPFSEVLCTARFERLPKTDDKYDTYLEFYGQAKTKGQSDEYYAANPSYVIPVLTNPADIIKAMDWLRSRGKCIRIEDYIDDQIARKASHTRYSKDLSRYCRIWSDSVQVLDDGTDMKKLSPHSLRELYALEACRTFGGSRTYDLNYAATILGHSQDDRTTAMVYQQDYELA